MHVFIQGYNAGGTQDIKTAISQEIYHMLGVAIVMGAARVSIAVIFAINDSALYCFLNLMDEENKISSHNPIKRKHSFPFRFTLSHPNLNPFLHLSAQDAVDHDDDETFQGVKDGKEDLEEGRAAVSDGEHGGHPGERQERENNAGTPERRAEEETPKD